MILPATWDGAEQSALVAKATKAAKALRRGRRFDDRYELCDMVQDGCLAEIRGRAAWYGVMDGMRAWLGRKRYPGTPRPRFVPLDHAPDCGYVSDPMRRLIAAEEFALAMGRMDRWQPKKRTAWMLRYMEDKREPVIGAILGVTPGRVSQWLLRY